MLRTNANYGSRLVVGAFLLAVLVLGGGCRRSPEARKAKFMESGKAYMKAKDYPRAILQFRNAAQLVGKGKDAEPFYQLGLALLADGQVRLGAQMVAQAARLNPDHTAARLKLAELETMTGNRTDLQDAEKTLESMIKTSPDNADALSTLGVAELQLGKEAEGVKNLEAALEKSPQNLKASVTMAKVKFAHSDLKGAEQVLQEAIRKDPKSASPLVALASFYVATQRWPEAESDLQQALQIDPNSDAALLTLAGVQVRTGQKDKAEQTYAKIAALPLGRYKQLHAQFLYGEGKHDQAIVEFAKLAKESPEDRKARTRLVAAYWFANRKADAEKVLTNALKHSPNDAEALTQRAQMELSSARYNEAQTDADQVLRYHPESALAHYIKANVYRAKGDSRLEQQELGNALQYKKDLLLARIQLAQSLLRQNDAKAALALLESKDVSPMQRMTLPWVIVHNYALLGAGEYDAAQTQVTAALAQMREPDLLVQDAMIKANKKDYAGARTSLEGVLKISPENLTAMDLLVKTYLAQNQVPAAITRIRQQVAAQPKSARLQKFLGDWLAGTGDRSGALQAYAAAKQLQPQLTGADMAMARIYVADNKSDQARQALNRVLQVSSNNADAYFWMGVLDERDNNFKAAVTDYRKVLTLVSNHVGALNNLAFLLADHGTPQQLDEALKLAQQVRALAQDNGNVDDTMGWVYYKKGMFDAAIQQLQDAVKRDTDRHAPSPLHQYHLAMAYLRNGNAKLGNETFRAAQKLDPNLPEAKQAQLLLAAAKTTN